MKLNPIRIKHPDKMATFLFNQIIFGPVSSRRLGVSLGINLLPLNNKICNFNCIYCECGLTETTSGELPSRQLVKDKLLETLIDFKEKGKPLDTITFAGNGEPTMHPDFRSIINDTIELRDSFFPNIKIAALTNATTLSDKATFGALNKIDLAILKVDSLIPETINILNCPEGNYDINQVISTIKKLENPIVQTMFVRGTYQNTFIDNTRDIELGLWVNAIKDIRPKQVMIYTIARDTPIKTLEKVTKEELKAIAKRITTLGLGIDVQISG